MVFFKNSITESDYISRINKVIDYIENNITEEFTLDRLSEIANFSKYHFHRIFQSVSGETLFQFILRMRLERSAVLLQTTFNKKSITDIAMECGFTSSALFSRSFRDFFKMTPTQFRRNFSYDKIEISNYGQTISNERKEIINQKTYITPINRTKWEVIGDDRIKYVEIKELEDIEIAYLRYSGNYKKNNKLFKDMFDKLYRWGYARDLIDEKTRDILIYHDSPHITNENKLRVSACITIPLETKVSGEIGKLILKGGKYGVIRFHISLNDFFFAWGWVYGVWLPSSGYLPDNKYCFEVYLKEKDIERADFFIIDIYVPIIPG